MCVNEIGALCIFIRACKLDDKYASNEETAKNNAGKMCTESIDSLMSVLTRRRSDALLAIRSISEA